MTNSSPPEPQNRRPILRRDEVIGVVVAFATIGSILYWGMGQKDGGWKLTSGDGLSSSLSGNTDLGALGQLKSELTNPQARDGSTSSPLARDKANSAGGSSPLFAFLPQGGKNDSQGKGSSSSPPVQSQQETDSQGGANFNARLPGFPGWGGIGGNSRYQSPNTSASGDETLENIEETPSSADVEASPSPKATFSSPQGQVEVSPSPEVASSPQGEIEVSPSPEAASPPPEAEVNTETETSPTPVTEFADIPEQYWAEPFIKGLAAKKIVTGFPGGANFQPDKPVTRAELAAQIRSAFEQPKRKSAIDFPDVSQDYWAKESIAEAVETGFMNGYAVPGSGPNPFRPAQEVSRVEVLVALVTGLNLQAKASPEETLKRYQDSDDIPDWAQAKIAAATEAGLVVNYPDLQALKPNEPATRAEVTAMIYQALLRLGRVEEAPSDYIVRPQ